MRDMRYAVSWSRRALEFAGEMPAFHSSESSGRPLVGEGVAD